MAEERRQAIRRPPEAREIAWVVQESNSELSITAFKDSALIIDVSDLGCSLVLLNRDRKEHFFLRGQVCMIKLGSKPMRRARVVRTEPGLAPLVFKVSFVFEK